MKGEGWVDDLGLEAPRTAAFTQRCDSGIQTQNSPSICRTCSTPLLRRTVRAVGHGRVYCDPRCRRARPRPAHRSRVVPSPPVHRCVRCATVLRIGGVGRPPLWCSGRCRILAINPRRCGTCGDILPSKCRVFCSASCRRVHLRITQETRECAVCGTEFTQRDRRQVNCSPLCGNVARKRARNQGESRRRFPRVRGRARLAVFERDGWRCGLCRGVIDRNLALPHPGSPSVDHVDPDGEHVPSNWQAAHLACNVEKGARAAA